MNLALRGIEADFGPEHADTFRRDFRADDVRWQFGVPPKGNANFARVQHFIHHLAPQGNSALLTQALSHFNTSNPCLTN